MMTLWLWVGFIAIVLAMLALDLGVFHKEDHADSTKEALVWTGVWIGLSLAFNVALYFVYDTNWLGVAGTSGTTGEDAAIQFFTGYLIEKSLSLDNIFVIALIFSYFNVPLKYQHRVLFWGVLGALVMRALMIFAGAALIKTFSWTVYVFGAFLIFTAVKMLVDRNDNIDPEKNALVKIAKRYLPVADELDGHHFFTRLGGRRAVTRLFIVLLVVESSDVIFAVDSIPAIFAVTHDEFIVFTSNIFAILGLRSLYFALASLLEKFRFLKESLVFVLAYVGMKMILAHHFPIPATFSLFMIIGILSVGILASIFSARRDAAKTGGTPPEDESERSSTGDGG